MLPMSGTVLPMLRPKAVLPMSDTVLPIMRPKAVLPLSGTAVANGDIQSSAANVKHSVANVDN